MVEKLIIYLLFRKNLWKLKKKDAINEIKG
jgi:hypothetical protein